ncbi:YebC/PmpR family DNA-binding transcriptional regulator [Thalassobacillus sp. C254]|uniref:YebC/PmpR family DNA-binding transcriptional regulator n=1 Tax=Thalassobacillus sp. C254 TaxID=1225341 RepID=UPI0006D21FD7|nr:YebC/PmpR family DNA-binding transcriptional regulator [Thalassobacillus sp. C254]
MAGHSKWNNIKRRKESQDTKRAKVFTKISTEIFAAVRESGDDPQTNLRLRLALSKAKAENMPNDNIERTIKKALGEEGGVTYEELTYEGYGPGGAAVMVKVLTDNKNRSAANVRLAFNKNGGNLGENGCVSFLFQRKGVLAIDKESAEGDEEDLMLDAIEAGAAEVEVLGESYELLTDPEDFESVKNALEKSEYTFKTAEVTMVPTTMSELGDNDAEKMIKLIDALEDNDDVQSVYHNFQIDQKQLDRLEV